LLIYKFKYEKLYSEDKQMYHMRKQI